MNVYTVYSAYAGQPFEKQSTYADKTRAIIAEQIEENENGKTAYIKEEEL